MLARLVVNLMGNYAPLQAALRNAQSSVSTFATTARATVSTVKDSVFSLKGVLVGGTAIAATSWMIGLSSQAEQLNMQFKTLTGSVQNGAKMFADIQKFAVRTSFSLETAGDAARALMASGVRQNDIIPTMTLLGNLAMGDAERMKLLAKAFTDVQNKGRLQAQELRQFAENNVPLIGELAAMFKVTEAEILSMSEAGEIAFGDMRKALERMTGAGGRFQNMMADMAETTKGRWDSVRENIDIAARGFMDQFVPAINQGLTSVNELLTGFNALPEKVTFLKDVSIATFDVVTETIKSEWRKMLADMLSTSKQWAVHAVKYLNPLGNGAAVNGQDQINQFLNKVRENRAGAASARLEALVGQLKNAAAVANAPDPNTPFENLDMAGRAQRLNALIDQINAADRNGKMGLAFNLEQEWKRLSNIHKELIDPAAPRQVAALTTAFTGLFERIKGPAAEIQAAVKGKIDRTLIQGQSALATLERMFTGEAVAKKDKEDKSFSPLIKGSAEAYKAIVAAMGGKDEKTTIAKQQLEETKKQTASQKMLAKKFENAPVVLVVDDLG